MPLTITQQWLRDGAAIPGATGTTYTLAAADVGALITCRETATNAAGSTSADSNALGPVAAAVSDPSALFAAGEAGDWWDAADLSRMWQDTAGTVPVTASGDPVARWDGQRGLVSLQQATASRRPLYQTASGLHWLQFAAATFGSLISAAALNLTGTDALTVCAAVQKPGDDAARPVFEHGKARVDAPGAAQPGYRAYYGGSTQASLIVSAGYPAPATHVLTLRGDVSDSAADLRINGAAAASVTTGLGTGALSNVALQVGRNSGGSAFFNGKLYALVVRGALTADPSGVEGWAAGKSGVTL